MRVASPSTWHRVPTLYHPGDGHRGDAITIAGVDGFNQIADGFVLMNPANIDLNGQGGCVQANGIFDIDSHQFVRKFLEDALAAA